MKLYAKKIWNDHEQKQKVSNGTRKQLIPNK